MLTVKAHHYPLKIAKHCKCVFLTFSPLVPGSPFRPGSPGGPLNRNIYFRKMFYKPYPKIVLDYGKVKSNYVLNPQIINLSIFYRWVLNTF